MWRDDAAGIDAGIPLVLEWMQRRWQSWVSTVCNAMQSCSGSCSSRVSSRVILFFFLFFFFFFFFFFTIPDLKLEQRNPSRGCGHFRWPGA